MSKIEWTPEQSDAISSDGSSIVVSAAAGSGKTAVLVERVIRLITDEDNPVLADRLVIVTFTEAAASEMKSRLSKKMEELTGENPDNVFYQNQNFLLSRANICTIHSFCLSLITENFQKSGLKSGFTIADENMTFDIKSKAIEQVFEDYYSEYPEKIMRLAEFFDSNGDKRLEKIIFDLDDFLTSIPYSSLWTKQQKNIYALSENDFTKLYLPKLSEYLKNILTVQKYRLSNLGKMIQKSGEKCLADNADMLSEIDEAIRNLEQLFENEKWKGIAESNFKLVKRWNGKNCIYNKEECQSLKKKIVDELREIPESLSDLLDDIEFDKITVGEILELLFEIYESFNKKITEIKSENNVVTFSDILHLTIKLLTDEQDGKRIKNAFAEELSHRYDYIIVDEFQDVNDVQDTIFKLVSQDEKNLFIVGDTKQSIYRFQQANPEIFINKIESSTEYDENDTESVWRKIRLSENFRSRKEILRLVNMIFLNVMKKTIGGIDYTGEELVYGAKYSEREDADPEIYFINEKLCKENGYEMDNPNSAEAEFVAQKIREMIDGRFMIETKDKTMRPCCEGDFCILMRSPSDRIYVYLDKLQKYGIKASDSDIKGFYSTREISSVINFLKVINNPLRDLNVAATLMSPMFMMTPEELAVIKTENPDISLFMATKKSNNQKSIRFIEVFDKLRRYASGYSLEKLVLKLYDETKILSVVKVMTNSEAREANLHFLVENIKGYEEKSSGGLSGYLRWIDKIKENGKDKAFGLKIESADSVNIMSIHKSKGLEFPICFVCGLGNSINIMDYNTSQTLLDINDGIGFKIRNSEEFEIYPSLPYKYLRLKGIEDTKGEELRLLYVALTRAKQKLICTANYKNFKKVIEDTEYRIFENKVIEAAVSNAGCMSDWILMSLMCDDKIRSYLHEYSADLSSMCKLKTEYCNIGIINSISETETEEACGFDENVTANQAMEELIKGNINFKYEYDELTRLPAKTTVTEIVHEKSGIVKITAQPEFVSDKATSGFETGNAYHKFLQYADFLCDVNKEIKRLKNQKLLTLKEAESINVEKISRIINSDFFRRITDSSNMWREYKFMSDINAKSYDSDISERFSNTPITIQGMADCIFEEDGELVLVDYKTDRVGDESELIKKYSKQLELYTFPIEKSLQKRIKQRIIYSIYLEKAITL